MIPTTVAAAALVGLALAGLVIKPGYTAKTTLLWEPQANADPSDRSFLTQVDSIKLASNLAEVKRRLRSKASVDELKEAINLLFDGQSHLVAIEANSTSAKGAAALAKTVVDVFLDYQRSIGRDRGSEHLRSIDADLVAAQQQLAAAREAYEAFRNELHVADFEVELKLALEKVAALKQQVELSGADAESEAVRQKRLQDEIARQPLNNVQSQSLTNPDALLLAQAQTKLASESAHLSPDHPTILRLKREVEALQERLKDNAGLVKSTVSVITNPHRDAMTNGLAASKVSQGVAAERREGYKRLLVEAEARQNELSAARGRAQQLLSTIASHEAHKNELEALRVRTLDQVRNASADFRVVTPATLPDKPNPSARRAVVIRLPIIALVLSILGIVGYELRGLRVHTAREAGFWANAAVVASSTWPREQTTLGALIDELSDAAPAVRGTTLVVGARVNEVPLAREIAYWLSHLTSGLAQRGVVGADAPVVTADLPSPGSANSQAPAGEGGGTALVRRGNEALTLAQAWDGPTHGPALRRASRLADRVLVVVASGAMSVTEIAQLRSRLGRSTGIGLLLVGLNPEFLKLPDRVGEVERFWEDRAA